MNPNSRMLQILDEYKEPPPKRGHLRNSLYQHRELRLAAECHVPECTRVSISQPTAKGPHRHFKVQRNKAYGILQNLGDSEGSVITNRFPHMGEQKEASQQATHHLPPNSGPPAPHPQKHNRTWACRLELLGSISSIELVAC